MICYESHFNASDTLLEQKSYLHFHQSRFGQSQKRKKKEPEEK